MNERLKWFVERAFGSRVFPAVLVVLLLVVGVAFASVSVPDTAYPDLSPTGDEPWIIEVPSFSWSYYVGQYSNGSCYAVNGSNGDKFLVGLPTAVLQGVADVMVDGDLLYIAGGVYVLTSWLTLSENNITVVGSGMYGGTVLRFADSVDSGVAAYKGMFMSDGYSGLAFRGLELDGNKDGQTKSGATAVLSGFWIGENSGVNDDVLVEDCYVHSFTVHGVSMARGERCVVRNNRVVGNGWNGICFGSVDINNCLAEGNFVSGSSDVGVSVYGEHHRVVGNQVRDINGVDGSVNTGCGIALEGGGSYPSDYCLVSGNYVTGDIQQAIVDSDGVEGNMICSNMIYDITAVGYGILVEGSNVTISGNKVFNMTGAGSCGIYLKDADNCSVLDNDVSYVPETAIRLALDSNFNVVIGNYALGENYGIDIMANTEHSNVVLSNVCSGAGTADFQDDGVGTVKHDNYGVSGAAWSGEV